MRENKKNEGDDILVIKMIFSIWILFLKTFVLHITVFSEGSPPPPEGASPGC